jgi:hypothetical protein
MFDEPEETPAEQARTPERRALEKADEFRMHAEVAAVFEAHRKFDAEIKSNLDPEIARDIQRTIGRLEKAKSADNPLLPPAVTDDAAHILDLPAAFPEKLSTNDYHIHRRPGETMIVRWLAGDQVQTFYTRLQAHFDAALNAFRAEERASNEWKQEPATLKYLDALDKLEIKMPDRYLRDIIRTHNVYILSTQSADEMDILHLCDYVMGVEAREIVGAASAPPEQPTEQDRAWFFKLFSLRGMKDGQERMCFFTYLQKSDDSSW